MIGLHIVWSDKTKGIAAYGSRGIFKTDSYLEWLLTIAEKSNNDNCVMYDMDANIAALLRLINVTDEEALQLYNTEHLYFKRPAGDKMVSYHLRCLSSYAVLYQDKRKIEFWDISPRLVIHYDGKTSPEDAIERAKTARDRGIELLEAYHKIGIAHDKPRSPRSAFEKQFYMDVPRYTDQGGGIAHLPSEVMTIARESLCGNWIEAYNHGFWDTVYDYDISGAYGYQLSRLLDTRRGQWIQATEPPKGAVYGWLRGLLHIPPEKGYFHPFQIKVSDNRDDGNYNPVGYFPYVITLDQLEFLKRWKLGTFKAEGEGWFWIPDPDKKQYECLKGMINWLWGLRGKAEGLEKDVIKIIINSMWGRLSETRPTNREKLGAYYNTAMASLVETRTRLQVAEACLQNGITPKQLTVDGIVTDTPLNLDMGTNLGQWRLTNEGHCVITSSAQVFLEGKKTSQRDFSLEYSWLWDAIENDPKADGYTLHKISPVTLDKAVALKKLNKLGELEILDLTIYVNNCDPKRNWKKQPRSGSSLISGVFDSEPWVYDPVKQLVIKQEQERLRNEENSTDENQS